jgi:release factor glutamine methyltransferase
VVGPKEVALFSSLVNARAQGKPIAYLLGKKEFWGLVLSVTPDVLIPRPETELLLETLKTLLDVEGEIFFADVGTGSGAVGLAMAHEFPRSRGLLTDVSQAALKVARHNVHDHGKQAQLQSICCDLLSICPQKCLDVVLSNPPYISSAAYWCMDREVRHFEPLQALWSGFDGVEVHYRLIREASRVLRPDGWLCMEIGFDQAAVLTEYLAGRKGEHVWSKPMVVQDLAGLDRVLAVQKV